LAGTFAVLEKIRKKEKMEEKQKKPEPLKFSEKNGRIRVWEAMINRF